jgi:ABC-type transport system involved in multi-copper enzyme maturation permease subunit
MSTAAATLFIPRRSPSFTGAVRSELLKIRRQALTWVLVALTGVAAVVALVSVVTSPDSKSNLLSHPQVFYFAYLNGCLNLFETAGGIFVLVVAARLIGMEYSGGTVRIVLARGTARLQLLLAQMVALAVSAVLLLAGFVVVAGAFLLIAVSAWQGSLASLPSAAMTDTGISLMLALVSMAVCILLGAAAAAVGRSLPFAIGVALAFFPADNFGTIVMSLFQRVTHQDLWPKLTQWFLGPSLNQLPVAMQTDHQAAAYFATPLVKVDATHLWVVIGAWSLLFLLAAIVLTWRRDVLE